MSSRVRSRELGVFALLAALLAAPAAGGELGTLDSLDDLAAAFNADAGTPRLILLFSPT